MPDGTMSLRLFVNGEFIGALGHPATHAADNRPGIGRYLSPSFRLERENEIVLEIANYDFYESGIRRAPLLGTYEFMTEDRRSRSWNRILIVGALGFMALYHLLLFSLERRELSALFFAVLCIGMSFRLFMVGEQILVQMIPGIDPRLHFKMVLVFSYMMLPAILLFVYYLFPDRFHGPVVWFFCAAILFVEIAVVLLPIAPAHSYTLPVFALLAVCSSLYLLVGLGRAALRRVPGTLLMFVAFAWCLPVAINDILHSMRVIHTGHFIEYGFVVFVFAQAFTVSRRIIQGRRLSEELARDLERSNVQLRSLDRLKDDFLANTSHELRTPLHGIIGIAGSLRDQADRLEPARLRDRLELIITSGKRLSDLVRDIMDFSALRYGDIPLTPGALDLRRFAEVQLTLIGYNRAPDQAVELFNDVPDDLPPVLADEARLTQIFQNILANALKHTARGEIRVQARSDESGMARVDFSDTGDGIPAEQLDQVFLPFEQASGAARKGGIGLGLPIARALAELHGGTLTAENKPGKGALFRLTLPFAGSEQAPPQHASTRLPPLALTSPVQLKVTREPEGQSSDLPLVLLVDDEPINLDVMREYLSDARMRVVTAASVAEARGRIAVEIPACVVLDIMLSDGSGLDYLSELRRVRSLTEVPVLMVTAMTRTRDLLSALDAGANDYLTKPFEKEEFLLRVGNLTVLSRSHQEKRDVARTAARQERERINADLHDHLGASLTDLKIISEKALENPTIDPGFSRLMYDRISASIQILRNDMLSLEDLQLLQEDFVEGMHVILLRRYLEVERELDYQAPAALPMDEARVQVLYAVLKEVVTNDLKYGSGPVHLRFTDTTTNERDASDERLRIEFESLSHYRLETHGAGRGTAGMIQRLSQIGGELKISIAPEPENGPRKILIRITV